MSSHGANQEEGKESTKRQSTKSVEPKVLRISARMFTNSSHVLMYEKHYVLVELYKKPTRTTPSALITKELSFSHMTFNI